MSTITQADGRRKRVNSGAEDRMVGSAGRTGWQDGQDGRGGHETENLELHRCELRVAVHGSPPRLGAVRFLRA